MSPINPIYEELTNLIRNLNTEQADLILKLVRAMQGLPMSKPYDAAHDPAIGVLDGYLKTDLTDLASRVEEILYDEITVTGEMADTAMIAQGIK